MLKKLSLSTRLYLSLSAIVVFFALVLLSCLLLYDRSAAVVNELETERVQYQESLDQVRTLTLKVDDNLSQWLLYRDMQYNLQSTLIWPRELNERRRQVLTLGQRWNDGPDRENLAYLAEQLVSLEQNFKVVEQLLPDVAAFKQTSNYDEALNIYAQTFHPNVRQVFKTLDALKASRYAAMEDRFTTYTILGYTFNRLVLFSIIGFGLFILLIGNYLIRLIIRPLSEIRGFIGTLASGELPESELTTDETELGQLAGSVNLLANNLKHSIELATKIGQGALEVDTTELNRKDPLGQALLTMHQHLGSLAEREARRNWAIAGFARFGDVLRKTTDMKMLCDEIISNLARYMKANLGAIFILNDDNPSEPKLVMLSSYAYNKRKFLHREFSIGEGLVGQAALELETIYITQIPENYVILTSGLGEAQPRSLVMVPLISSENIYGVIELASFNHFTPEEIEFVKRLGENIAAVVSNMKSNEKTLRLLEQSRKLGAELQQKSEQLESSNQRMLITQQEVQQSNQQLETQMRKLNQTALELSQSEKRFFSLLENASEIITVFEKDGSVRYQSPSLERILGYKPDELTNFFRYVYRDDIPAVKKFFINLLENPQQQFVAEYRYLKKDGAVIYLESLGKNLLSDTSITGIVVNTRDITERIRADLNATRRMQFQSLTENSPDLITRFDLTGKYLYINPVIERYTGKKPEFFIQNTLHTVGLSANEVRFWENLIQTVSATQRKQTGETYFPSILGDRVMQVEVIPEFNLENKLETLLVVSHDITEIKQIETKILDQNHKLQLANQEVVRQNNEIEEKNKDITESIRYAMRIQESILPARHVMEHALGHMLIIFKPRDIVSGDFYWYFQKGDKILVAVVDCTGHGVPGAFMSLIGYTLLNQIVGEQGIIEASKILDSLNSRVRLALKQSEKDQGSKDGMDVAICRIDLGKRIVQFAGAHRPIYWWHQYELHEIKGDKFGVGGTELEPGEIRQFASHELRIETGDALYLFSDGFIDQFGGPEGKKYTPKRLRELLIRNQHRSMHEQQRIIEKHFEEWRGSQRQVDDVVLVGVRF